MVLWRTPASLLHLQLILLRFSFTHRLRVHPSGNSFRDTGRPALIIYDDYQTSSCYREVSLIEKTSGREAYPGMYSICTPVCWSVLQDHRNDEWLRA